jgi:hypothetical protein
LLEALQKSVAQAEHAKGTGASTNGKHKKGGNGKRKGSKTRLNR